MKLGEMVSLVRGNTYKSSLLSETDGPVLLGLGSIERGGGFKRGSWKRYPGYTDIKILLHPGDIYVSLKDLTQSCDLLGAVSRVPDDLPVGRLTQDTVKLEFNSNVSEQERLYVYWSLRTPQYRAYCKARGAGTTNMSLSRADFLAWELPPRSPVRDMLIALFELIDKKIELNNQLNGYLAALGETMATRCSNETDGTLDDICSQSKETVSLEAAQLETYVSTENLLPNKAGLQLSAGLPTSGKVTRYRKGDTLVANIRPYFKKIWYATDEGTCSGDVIVFRANDARYAPYVFFSLCRDEFFEYVTLGAKGTKMPRGDKKQMMTFPICTNCNSTDLQLLHELASMIGTNHAESRQLMRLRDTLLPKLMSGEIDVSKVDLTQLNSHLADC